METKPWSRDESLSLTLNIRSVSATDLYEYESQDKTMIGYHTTLVKNLYELIFLRNTLELTLKDLLVLVVRKR